MLRGTLYEGVTLRRLSVYLFSIRPLQYTTPWMLKVGTGGKALAI